MGIKQKYKVEIEVLSPLHIGNGNRLKPGVDCFFDDNVVKVISFDEMLQKFSGNREAIAKIAEKLAKGESLYEFLRPEKSSLKAKYIIRTENSIPRNEILEQYKIPELRPAIPGSSIKGAMRTVLLQHAFKENPSLKKNIIADKSRRDKASEEVFGERANFDPLRVLIVDDFATSIDAISLSTVKVLDVKNGNSYGWKNFSSKFVETQISKATPIIIEAIKPGSRFEEGTISIDIFTLEKLEEQGQMSHFGSFFHNFLENFLKVANDYAVKEAYKEIEFLKNFDNSGELREVAKFLEQIKRHALEDKNQIYLRLAWGIGWKGMTGDYLEDEEIETVRKKFPLGRDYSKVFPKTRRLVTGSENGREIPLYPTGWIRIRRIQ